MAKPDEVHAVSVRKPVTEVNGVLAFEDDCFRIGRKAYPGTVWQYEIPFSEITQIEYKAVRDIMRGRLKDGTEFDFRFASIMNPAKAARQGTAINLALGRIPASTSEGGSIRSVGSTSSAAGAGQPDTRRRCATPGCEKARKQGNFCEAHSPGSSGDPGCLGCFGSAVVTTMPILAIVAYLI